MKFLFVLKQRHYNSGYATSYGLVNSANQVANYLISIGNECKVVSVVDGNGIDKEVFNYKPNVVIIEALWATADKMKELIEIKRYKDITWIVRIHSDIGFLAAETIALPYINGYIELNKNNLFVAVNNKGLQENLSDSMDYNFLYLPNIIEVKDNKKHSHKKEIDIINIGCFGDLRVLKNQLYQAVCAIRAANILGKKLLFHINQKADTNVSNNSVLMNLKALFESDDNKHELVIHNWSNVEDFHKIIQTMDLGLQLSFTESFNIVAADFVNNDVLIAVSDAIKWLPRFLKTSTVDYNETIAKIITLYYLRNNKILKYINRKYLNKYNNKAKMWWKELIKDLK